MKHKVVLKKSVFPASRDVVWEKLQQLTTLQYIAKPFASFLLMDSASDFIWEEDKTFQLYFRLFCLIPFGVHTIHVIRFQKDTYEVYTKEVNVHVPIWNHKIILREIERDRTEYTDEVELYAGWKTPFVCLWANCFYTHRQKKWLKLL
ncbi:hypothetical protein [Clostridium sp. D33t1_170424_F3]|uniref:hypothetical protein n=1 Tax=Clostridium sp. D33t1_170424_F3 TaxID=2787099 RepID=UPI0018AC1794|nr:hypothetical protein [Clostridium sp. D33t1_170424_F3]